MKLVKDINLFFREGNSDKVYIVELIEVSPEKYLVNFKYGRRGQAYKEGTKTPEFVSLANAELLFAALEKEKRNKGYQSEQEIEIALPNLSEVAINSKEGAILQRLSNAVNNNQTFKTEWKTSRVIWKAIEYKIEQAIPYLIKLISKGDEAQTYSCLYGLAKMKVKNAEPIFTSFSSQPKQKFYIKNVATMGLLMTLENQELKDFEANIASGLSEDVQEILHNADYNLLLPAIDKKSEEEKVSCIHKLFFLSYNNHSLRNIVNHYIENWPLQPPYFKAIRSIYKLSILADDFQTMATCAYAFEKKNHLFNRKVALSNKNKKQEFSFIDERVNPKVELSSEDSRLAFSKGTKLYLQRSSVKTLDSLGNLSDSKLYLQAAIAILSRYKDIDYMPPSNNLLSSYGRYDYNNGKYYFTKMYLPECYNSLLLSNIIFDVSNIHLDGNLHFINKKEVFSSKNYYYNENEVKQIKNIPLSNKANTNSSYSEQNEDTSLLKSTFSKIKSWFGGKKEDVPIDNKTPIQENTAEPQNIDSSTPTIIDGVNIKYKHHWDNNPHAYIKLLFDANMDRVLQFAYDGINRHPSKELLKSKFSKEDLIKLFNKSHWANKFAFEVLQSRQAEFVRDIDFVANILDSNSADAIKWAFQAVELDKSFFFEDINFIAVIMLNKNNLCKDKIDKWLQDGTFTESRKDAIAAKTIINLLSLNESVSNEESAKSAQSRLFSYFEKSLISLTEKALHELLESPLNHNAVIASEIAAFQYNKSNKLVSINLILSFLNDDNLSVNKNGLLLMSKLDGKSKEENLQKILPFIHHANGDVVKECFSFFETINDKNLRIEILSELLNSLIRKEKYEDAHNLHFQYINSKFSDLYSNVNKSQLMNLIHCNYRIGQEMGYEILKNYEHTNDLSMGQIISLGNHELLSLRQWCYNYYNTNTARIKKEKDKSLKILNSTWIETKDFAFNYFRNNFGAEEWDLETLIQLIDNTDLQNVQFGKEMLTKHFNVDYSNELIEKLTQHPNITIQSYATDLIHSYGVFEADKLADFSLFFKTVLTNVHKGRATKTKVYNFFERVIYESEKHASSVANIINEISATSLITDKERCISILSQIKSKYPEIKMNLQLQNNEL